MFIFLWQLFLNFTLETAQDEGSEDFVKALDEAVIVFIVSFNHT
jgi:hypothetical protein